MHNRVGGEKIRTVSNFIQILIGGSFIKGFARVNLGNWGKAEAYFYQERAFHVVT